MRLRRGLTALAAGLAGVQVLSGCATDDDAAPSVKEQNFCVGTGLQTDSRGAPIHPDTYVIDHDPSRPNDHLFGQDLTGEYLGSVKPGPHLRGNHYELSDACQNPLAFADGNGMHMQITEPDGDAIGHIAQEKVGEKILSGGERTLFGLYDADGKKVATAELTGSPVRNRMTVVEAGGSDSPKLLVEATRPTGLWTALTTGNDYTVTVHEPSAVDSRILPFIHMVDEM